MGSNQKEMNATSITIDPSYISKAKSLLYLGCGHHGTWADGSGHMGLWEYLDMPKVKIGFDANNQRCATWSGTDWKVFCEDVGDLSMFGPKCFDEVVSIDFLEHLSYGGGARLLQEIDRVCKRESIIITPRGFLDTRVLQPYLVFNEWDVHNSGWEKEDLEAWGYRVEVLPSYHKFDSGDFDVLVAVKRYE
jgi:hypothetical protein